MQYNKPDLFMQAGQSAPIWPANVPIYDLQTQAPFLFEQFNPVFEAYKKLREEEPEKFKKLLKSQAPELPAPREGASKVLQWEVNVVCQFEPVDSSYFLVVQSQLQGESCNLCAVLCSSVIKAYAISVALDMNEILSLLSSCLAI